MELCVYTDSVQNLTRTDALDVIAKAGATAVELAVGGQSSAPHMNLSELLSNKKARDTLIGELNDRGLRIGALNCSAWPMHPIKGVEHVEIIKGAMKLAQLLDVKKIVTMSGCPGDGPNSSTINWVFFPWPSDGVELLNRQWTQTLDLWTDLAAFGGDHGIKKIAFELHPMHLVYNTPTLLKIRQHIGPIIGANVDPSHLFWQHMDPVAMVRALGDAVHHVHLKDLEFNQQQLGIAGTLDSRTFANPAERSWNFRTVGKGHGDEFWTLFFNALDDIGYDDVLSIENEDPYDTFEQGTIDAAKYALTVLSKIPK
jgi:sugar phosphate isomerase/epimerase